MVLSGGASLVAALPMVIPAEPTVPYQLDGIWRVRFNAPGCYGLQIDWPQGMEQIIVQAEAEQGTG
jgi:hypothetical protein